MPKISKNTREKIIVVLIAIGLLFVASFFVDHRPKLGGGWCLEIHDGTRVPVICSP